MADKPGNAPEGKRDADRPLRVLHVVGSTAFAGTERHVLGLVAELRGAGCEAELACPRAAQTLRREAALADVPVRRIFSELREGVDIIHVHDGRSALLGLALAVLARAALVRTQHFVLPASAARPGWRGRASLVAHRLVNGRLDGYVCVSSAAARAARERRDAVEAPLAVIPSGVRLATETEIEQARTERAEVASAVVITAGRLERERRIDVLLDAIPLVRSSFPSCRFVVAGAGDAESELKSHARALGLDTAIDWTGWLPEITPILARGQVYVNTWPNEGFGMATAEAMGYGLPVIVTNTGASPELVEDGISGMVVTALDPLALACKICELLSDRGRAERIGAAARSRAASRYSMRSTAASMLDFYERLPRIRRER